MVQRKANAVLAIATRSDEAIPVLITLREPWLLLSRVAARVHPERVHRERDKL